MLASFKNVYLEWLLKKFYGLSRSRGLHNKVFSFFTIFNQCHYTCKTFYFPVYYSYFLLIVIFITVYLIPAFHIIVPNNINIKFPDSYNNETFSHVHYIRTIIFLYNYITLTIPFIF